MGRLSPPAGGRGYSSQSSQSSFGTYFLNRLSRRCGSSWLSFSRKDSSGFSGGCSFSRASIGISAQSNLSRYSANPKLWKKFPLPTSGIYPVAWNAFGIRLDRHVRSQPVEQLQGERGKSKWRTNEKARLPLPARRSIPRAHRSFDVLQAVLLGAADAGFKPGIENNRPVRA